MRASAPTGDDRLPATATSPGAGEGSASPAPPAARVGLFRSRRLWTVTVLLGLLLGAFLLVRPQLSAWQHFRAARLDLERYHTRAAIGHLQVCLRQWPGDPDVLLMAARASRRARSYDEAERCLEKYQQARGLDEAGSFEQLLLSTERTLDAHLDARCRRLVEQDHPDTPLLLEALARGYLRQYRLVEARKCLDLWLERQPDNTQALTLLGQFHLDYERAPQWAVERYRQALDLDPDHEEARLGLAVTLLESKDFAGASVHLEHLSQVQPDNLRVQVGLAECRYAVDGPAEAIRLLDDLLGQHPDLAPALALRGRIALEMGEEALAEKWLRRAVARAPNDYQARYNLILCLHRNRQTAEARRHEQWIEQRKKDVSRFHDIVTRELSARPNDPALHCTLGELLLRAGHAEEGLRWLQSALRLDPQHAAARQALKERARQGQSEQQPAD